MSMPAATEARRLVLEPSSERLYRIAGKLASETAPLEGGVAPALLAEVLKVGEPENWPRATRSVESHDAMFRPFFTGREEDGNAYRSFLPDDLGDGDEAPLRTFAQASRNDFVRARVFEVLWARFHKFPDAEAAITARLACAKQCNAETDWPGMVKNLGRLTTLIQSVNARTRIAELADRLDDAAQELRTCSRPFSFPVLADMVANTLLAKKATRLAFGEERGNRWAEWLDELTKKYRGDDHHGHDALVVLQAWLSRWGRTDEAVATRRDIVKHLHDIADASEPMKATSLRQKALQAALDYGLSDLAEQGRIGLMGAIKSAVPDFKRVSGSIRLPPELVAQLDTLMASTPSLPAAIRQVAIFPGLFEVDVDDLKSSAVESLKDTPLMALMPSVHYHEDGKVTHRADGFEGNVERQVAFLIGTHLVLVELLLRRFLAKTIAVFEPTTLQLALASWPHLPKHHDILLAKASERFAARDWVSSAFIILPLYEAVLRDLLRAGGYSAMKVEPGGLQMDETLNSLIRSDAARNLLGGEHCDLVEYVLCDAQLGWNLRNEVSHGTIRPDALTPTRVLLVWLLVVRLTCFVAKAAPGDGDESSADVDPSDECRAATPGEGASPSEDHAAEDMSDVPPESPKH